MIDNVVDQSSVTSCSDKATPNDRWLGTRVLFAEDDQSIRSLVSEVLRDEGLEVVEAANGDEAACLFDNRRFDLLVTDVRMPGSKDGLDLAAHARQNNPGLPIVVVTGYADQLGARVKLLGKHVILLGKPFHLHDLMTSLHRAMILSGITVAVEATSCSGCPAGLQELST